MYTSEFKAESAASYSVETINDVACSGLSILERGLWNQFRYLEMKTLGGGGELPYERGGDARRKFWIKPLKETNLGMDVP